MIGSLIGLLFCSTFQVVLYYLLIPHKNYLNHQSPHYSTIHPPWFPRNYLFPIHGNYHIRPIHCTNCHVTNISITRLLIISRFIHLGFLGIPFFNRDKNYLLPSHIPTIYFIRICYPLLYESFELQWLLCISCDMKSLPLSLLILWSWYLV